MDRHPISIFRLLSRTNTLTLDPCNWLPRHLTGARMRAPQILVNPYKPDVLLGQERRPRRLNSSPSLDRSHRRLRLFSSDSTEISFWFYCLPSTCSLLPESTCSRFSLEYVKTKYILSFPSLPLPRNFSGRPDPSIPKKKSSLSLSFSSPDAHRGRDVGRARRSRPPPPPSALPPASSAISSSSLPLPPEMAAAMRRWRCFERRRLKRRGSGSSPAAPFLFLILRAAS